MAKDWGQKDPDEIITYGIDMSPSLDDGDSISTVAWVFVTAAGCTKSLEGFTGTMAKVRISAGTAGLTMIIELTVNTTNGEKLEERAKLKIKNTT